MIEKYFRLFKIENYKKISLSELKRRYRILCLKTHPDRGGSSAQFRLVQDAYQYIKNLIEKYLKEESEKIYKDKNHLYYSDGSVFDKKSKRWKIYKGRKINVKA